MESRHKMDRLPVYNLISRKAASPAKKDKQKLSLQFRITSFQFVVTVTRV